MKNIYTQIFFITIAALFFSCKKVKNKEMTVVKDCTGAYLRFNNKDYKVCNEESLQTYESGTAVTATFKKTSTCAQDHAVCLMAHESAGWVEVQKVEE